MKFYDKIVKKIDNMDNEDLVNIWNEYCDFCNNSDDRIYPMDEFEEENTPPRDWDEFWEKRDELEDFDTSDSYWFRDNGWDLRSTDNPWDVVCENDMARDIADGKFEPDWDFDDDDDDEEEPQDEPQPEPQEEPKMTADEISELAKKLFAMEG